LSLPPKILSGKTYGHQQWLSAFVTRSQQWLSGLQESKGKQLPKQQMGNLQGKYDKNLVLNYVK
jgi:hypothetical protein